MITVYFWSTEFRVRFGHASLSISAGQSNGLDTYVSWWPGLPDGKPDQPIVPRTYKQDADDEGSSPTGIVSITGLDEAAMRREWQHLLNNNPRYSIGRKNCAWSIKKLLDAGTGYDLAAMAADFATVNMAVGIWTPRNVFEYAKLIKIRYDWRFKRANRFEDAKHTPYQLRIT